MKESKEERNIEIEYFNKFKLISEEAALLFDKYLEERLPVYVPDDVLKNYILKVMRDAMDDYIGVSRKNDPEAFVEIYKLKRDDFKLRRFDIFKDVAPKVIKHFEDIGYTLSERNISSIEWWIANFI